MVIGGWMTKHIKLGIIGAGAAGLSAALFAGRHKIKTIIFDSKSGGGRVGGIPYITSYPGLEGIKGSDFIKSLKAQVQALPDVDFHELEPVSDIDVENEQLKLITNKDEYLFDRVILAMGVEHKKLNVTGETEYSGRGVSYCAACDGLFFRNKDTIVIGNDTHALEQAMFLAELQSNVTLINPKPNWNAEPTILNNLQKKEIAVLQNFDVKEIFGERVVDGVRVSGVDIEPQNEIKELEAKGIFISMGFSPRTELVEKINLRLTTEKYVEIDQDFRTNMPQIYAVGDLTAPDQEIVSVCASGANAVIQILKEFE
jgi:thioredoxin reductase (NADPH)